MWLNTLNALARSRTLICLNVILVIVTMLVMVVSGWFFFSCYIQQLFLNGTNSSFGRPGVECYCQHDSGAAVIQLQFLINEVSKRMYIFHNSEKIQSVFFQFLIKQASKSTDTSDS